MAANRKHSKIGVFLGLACLCLAPTEGHVSKVYYSQGPTLEETLKVARHVVKVTNLHRSEIFKEVQFPKETAFNGQASTYREIVDLYQVSTVLLSAEIQPGEIIRVWKKPDYSEPATNLYHEKGISKSLIIATYTPSHPPQENTPLILILDDMKEKTAGTFGYMGGEDVASEVEVRRLLKKNQALFRQACRRLAHKFIDNFL